MEGPSHYQVEAMIDLLGSARGVDKLYRFVGYSLNTFRQILTLFRKTRHLEFLDHIAQIESTLSNVRRVFRFFQPYVYLRDFFLKFSLPQQNRIQRLNLFSNITGACCYMLDHIIWLIKVKMLKTSPRFYSAVNFFIGIFWLGGLLISLVSDGWRLSENINYTRNLDEFNPQDHPDHKELLKKLERDNELTVENMLRNIFDAPLCLSMLKPSAFENYDLYLVFCSAISSLIGLIQALRSLMESKMTKPKTE
mmetsp:Transcript_28657/g.32757  ORF Transcript_28657/g.32757 Transcript_28657/m.32757 type:complete len:251 (+) Transcript_28657:50-802(+)|eukprot:CAMPEP_0115040702 /NCGR_PEP_ID=MMETSP0216-20121206/44984_1 /TAXON_ID=223996 /ORGANISM="Protocruzia adherens, Strain Boccale" /LENGTH=250 /DNA_ID=CAMNT_0002421989 /DNA_START=102 /DNA_END=854 /DNA_ORIENTATION=-